MMMVRVRMMGCRCTKLQHVHQCGSNVVVIGHGGYTVDPRQTVMDGHVCQDTTETFDASDDDVCGPQWTL